MRKISIVFAFSAILFACSHKTTPTATTPIDNTVQPAPAALTMEEKGALYAASCVRCHRLVNPDEYTQEEWVGWLDKMAPKAKLTAEQKANVYDYLSANSKSE